MANGQPDPYPPSAVAGVPGSTTGWDQPAYAQAVGGGPAPQATGAVAPQIPAGLATPPTPIPQPQPSQYPDPSQPGLPAPYTGPPARGGAVKNALTRMMYGMGQAMLQHVGLPTDYDIQRSNFQQALQAGQQQIAQAHQQMLEQTQRYQETMIPITTPQGYTIYAPPSAAGQISAAALRGQAQETAAQTAHRFIPIPNVGLYDAKQGQVLPGTTNAIPVDDALVSDYPQLEPFKGKNIAPQQLLTAFGQELRQAPRTSSTVQYMQDAAGNVVALPRTTVTTVGRPAGGAAAPGPVPAGGGIPPAAAARIPPGSPAARAITARPVTEPTGEPMQGPAYNTIVNQLDSKYFQPANGVERSYQMMNTAYNEYKDAQSKGQQLPTGAQSMLALSNHLSTTFGGVKGARITKDLIREHLGARSVSDDMLTAMQRFTNGDVLSPNQWDAFHDLIGQSRNITWQLAANASQARKVDPTPFLPPDLRSTLGGVPGQVRQGPGLQIQRDAGGRIIGVQ